MAEDFTTYTLVDPSGNIDVQSSTAARVTNLANNVSAYLYKDYGTDHYAGAFNFQVPFKAKSSSADFVTNPIWAVSNVLSDLRTPWANPTTAGNETLSVYWYQDGSVIYISVAAMCSAGLSSSATAASLAFDTQYYIDIDKNYDYGTYGQIVVNIYDDAGMTNLVASTSLTLAADDSYRYAYGVQSYNDGTSGLSSWNIGDVTEPAALQASSTISFSTTGALTIPDMDATGAMSFSIVEMDGEGRQDGSTGDISFTMPGMEGYSGAQGAVSFTMPELDATGIAGEIGSGQFKFKRLVLAGAAAARGAVSFVQPTLAGVGNDTGIASGSIRFKRFIFAATGYGDGIAAGDLSFYRLRLAGSASPAGGVATGTIRFKRLLINATGSPAGVIYDGSIDFLPLTIAATGFDERLASGEFSFPILILGGTASSPDRFDGYDLEHVSCV